MRHQVVGAKLNRTSSHRQAMLSNMATSLLMRERITTTKPKAMAVARFTEKLITLARRGDLHARREVARTLRDEAILRKLFSDLASRYKDRAGGYTRVIQLPFLRKGDAASMAILELIDSPLAAEAVHKVKVKKEEKKGEARAEKEVKASAKEQIVEEHEEKERHAKEKGAWKVLRRMLGWHTKTEAPSDKSEKIEESHRKTSKGTGRSGSKKDSRGKSD